MAEEKKKVSKIPIPILIEVMPKKEKRRTFSW
jgi:hypothetical protein